MTFERRKKEPKMAKRCADETLTIDLYYKGVLVNRDISLPIHYTLFKGSTLTGEGDKWAVEINEAARRLIKNPANHVLLKFFTQDRSPAKPLAWNPQTKGRPGWVVDCETIAKLKQKHVSINLDPYELSSSTFQCRMCDNVAVIANTHYMMAFCGQACHTNFLEEQGGA